MKRLRTVIPVLFLGAAVACNIPDSPSSSVLICAPTGFENNEAATMRLVLFAKEMNYEIVVNDKAIDLSGDLAGQIPVSSYVEATTILEGSRILHLASLDLKGKGYMVNIYRDRPVALEAIREIKDSLQSDESYEFSGNAVNSDKCK